MLAALGWATAWACAAATEAQPKGQTEDESDGERNDVDSDTGDGWLGSSGESTDVSSSSETDDGQTKLHNIVTRRI